MTDDELFVGSDTDPFDDPLWKAAKGPAQTADFVGCPMKWLEQVYPYMRGPGQLVVALLLYRKWVLCGRRKTFSFSNGGLKRFGITRPVKARALTGLKDAGMITVRQSDGHAAQVTVTRRWPK